MVSHLMYFTLFEFCLISCGEKEISDSICWIHAYEKQFKSSLDLHGSLKLVRCINVACSSA